MSSAEGGANEETEMTAVSPLPEKPDLSDDYPDDLDDIPEDPDVPDKSDYPGDLGDGDMDDGVPSPVLQPPLDTERICEEFNLFQCARNGYLDKAQALLKNEKVRNEINNDDEDGLSPLHYAARYNHFDMLKLLIEHEADVNSGDHDKMTPLMYACRLKRKRKKSRKSTQQLLGSPKPHRAIGDTTLRQSLLGGKMIDVDASSIHFLIESGADFRHKDEYGLTALHHSALRGDEVACEQLLLYVNDEATPVVDAKDVQLMTPLHTAVCQSRPDIVYQLLQAGADVRSQDEEFSTPLHEAATIGDTKIAKLIMESCKHETEKQTALVSDRDEDGNTALMLAVESGKYNFVHFMIKRGAAINTTNNMNMTPLHLAAIKGDLRIVELLVGKGAKITSLNQEQQTPLHKACLFNNIECVKFLLDSGSHIEAKDRDNFTPLLLAASYGHAGTVELLLQRGASVSAEEKNDKTAVYLAAEENKLDVLEVLMKFPEMKALINHRDECNNSPLHIAASLGHIGTVQCLLRNGAILASKNDMEQTPMHLAAENGWTMVVREIAMHDKNALNDGDENSNTALHLAAEGGHVRLVEILLDLGAGPEIRNSSLRTPLGTGSAEGHLKVIKILIGADAMIDVDDKLGLTPLLVAAQNGHAEVVELLINKKADVSKCDLYGRNCLDLAIINDHVEVAMEILKSGSWENALRNSNTEDGILCTPLRRLIRKMPEMAEKVFDNCIEVKKPDEGSTQKLSAKFEVVFNFEFLDDLYMVHKWTDKAAFKRREKLKELHQEADTDGELLQTGFVWDRLKPFRRRDRTLIPYTHDSEMFRKNHPMIIMVQSSRLELLDHPLVTALRRHKWVCFGRFFYYVSFLAYTIFLAFLTGYILVTPPPFEIAARYNGSSGIAGDNDCERYENEGYTQNLFAKIGKYFILILAVMNLIKEIFQAFHTKVNYLTWENALEVLIFICSFLFVLDIQGCQSVTGYRFTWQWNFGAIAIVLAWIGLVMFIQKFPKIGIYVVMFNNILHTFFKFFIVFLLFIIAFGLGFFCLIQNQTPYATAYHAIIRTSVMMIGEFDYNDIFHGEDEMHYWLTYVLFCGFLLIMSIITMNLLVGLAVDDIKGVQDQAAVKRIAMKAHLVLDVERIHLQFTSRWYRQRISEFCATVEEVAIKTKHTAEFEDQIQKSQQKVLKKIDKMKSVVKHVQKKMGKVEEMLEAIMRAQNIQLNTEEGQMTTR